MLYLHFKLCPKYCVSIFFLSFILSLFPFSFFLYLSSLIFYFSSPFLIPSYFFVCYPSYVPLFLYYFLLFIPFLYNYSLQFFIFHIQFFLLHFIPGFHSVLSYSLVSFQADERAVAQLLDRFLSCCRLCKVHTLLQITALNLQPVSCAFIYQIFYLLLTVILYNVEVP